MVTSLDLLRPGMQAEILEIRTKESLVRRLRDFGLIPGTKVTCRFRCPWGDVTALYFRGSMLALRTEDLRRIRVRCP